MKKTIAAIGASMLLLLSQAMPIFANDVLGEHLDAAKTASSEVVAHLKLATTSTTGEDVDTHTDEALEQLMTVEEESSQAATIAVNPMLLVKLRVALLLVGTIRYHTEKILTSANMQKTVRAQAALTHARMLRNFVSML